MVKNGLIQDVKLREMLVKVDSLMVALKILMSALIGPREIERLLWKEVVPVNLGAVLAMNKKKPNMVVKVLMLISLTL